MLGKKIHPIIAQGTLNCITDYFVERHTHWQIHLFRDGKTSYHINPFSDVAEMCSGVCGIVYYDGLGVLEYIYDYKDGQIVFPQDRSELG
jgi:hypothetical protein